LFHEKESQEKTLLQWPDFFLLRSPLDGAGSVLNCCAMYSVAGHICPVIWIFSTIGFHHFSATKPVRSDTSKADRVLMWRPWFYPGLVADSFFWLSKREVVRNGNWMPSPANRGFRYFQLHIS
jgi:hypothetical protein